MGACVALRKESVDRNDSARRSHYYGSESLSARRAWIEMLKIGLMLVVSLVALRKESVDRNVFLTLTVRNVPSRSPQGERG